MEDYIEDYVKTCPRCLKFKAIPERAELNLINVTRPLELVHIDFLTIEAPKKDKRYKYPCGHGSLYQIWPSLCNKVANSTSSC